MSARARGSRHDRARLTTEQEMSVVKLAREGGESDER